jgi:hypothetical protein
MMAIQKINSWIERNYPRTVMLNAGDERILLSIYTYMQNPKPELAKAIERIRYQMPYWPDGNAHEYIMYVADKRALSKMCNEYCMMLADAYDRYPVDFAGLSIRIMAEDNYKKCTELYIQLQA